MRVLFDYRAALRERSGVGEYTHWLAAALFGTAREGSSGRAPIDLTLFSSSWKDRLHPASALAGVRIVDRRVPVRVLNFAWHRLEWPAAETLTGSNFDVVHSLHPLLMPSKAAAQVVTIYDLNFLHHPERTRAEIRRDYPALARRHAQRADRVIVISQFTASEVVNELDISPQKISICVPGAPDWIARERAPRDGYLLFLGTLEPRKNVGALLDAYEQLIRRRTDMPRLLLAGRAIPESDTWLRRIANPPLKDRVRHIGYVPTAERRQLFDDALVLVQPSFEEGFGLPVLEAMTAGVPVVAANRGALPEVLGEAGILVDPEDRDAMARAIERMVDHPDEAAAFAAKGVERSRLFSWERAAVELSRGYEAAIEHRAMRPAAA